MIYRIFDLIESTQTWVCPDQSSIETGKNLGYEGNFIIGAQSDADSILKTNQDAWLIACADRFSVCKDIDPDPIQITWIVCDLNTESNNTTQDYNIFDTINGEYNLATGLDNAKELYAQTQQNCLTFSGLDTYKSSDTWNFLPKPVKTTGTQTL